MSEMIERLARAMWEKNRRLDAEVVGLESWEEANDALHGHWLAIARAAIEAMCEPTDVMRHVGFDALTQHIHDTPYGAGVAVSAQDHVWQAMIDAALSSSGEQK